MQQSTIEIQVPKNLLSYSVKPETVQELVKEWLALELFTSDQVSSGKVAKLLGISRIEFLDLLHQGRIAYLDYDDEELNREFETVRNLQLDAPR